MPKLSQLAFATEVDAFLVVDREGAHPFHVNGTGPPKDALSVKVRPDYYTRRHEQAYAEATLVQGVGAATISRLIEVVAAWDLQDEKGVVIPLKEEALADIPTRLLDQIIVGCFEAMTPNATSSSG